MSSVNDYFRDASAEKEWNCVSGVVLSSLLAVEMQIG